MTKISRIDEQHMDLAFEEIERFEADQAGIDLADFTAALAAPRDAARCGSKYTYGRVCGLLRGHRTKLHRDCEVSWPDEKAIG